MVHRGQGLAFGFERRHYLTGVHPQLDDLEGDAAADWFALFGGPDGAKTAFTQFLEQLVATDDGA
jgi:hypothetical protein